MGRSTKKGPFVDRNVYQKVERMNETGRKDPITTWARACTIIPEFVGHTFMVHNGKQHLKVFVTEDMVGHRLESSLQRGISVGTAARRRRPRQQAVNSERA